MAGNGRVARAGAFLSLIRERGTVRVRSEVSLIMQTPHLHPLPYRRREATKIAPSVCASSCPRIRNILCLEGSRTPFSGVFLLVLLEACCIQAAEARGLAHHAFTIARATRLQVVCRQNDF